MKKQSKLPLKRELAEEEHAFYTPRKSQDDEKDPEAKQVAAPRVCLGKKNGSFELEIYEPT
jgi:hypothetical protein